MEKQAGEFTLDRFVVPYRVYGNAPQAIVCISGAKQTMSAWRSFISFFHKKYRVIVFDMPGQGRGQITSGSHRVTLDEQIAVLQELMRVTDMASLNMVCLAGSSWGSIVAAAYAERYPQEVHKTILGSFGTKPNMVLNAVIKQVQELIEAGRAKDIAPMMIEKFGQHIPDSLKRQILAQFDKMSDAQYRSFYEHSVFVTEMGDLKEYVNLRQIEAHSLVIMGQFDTIMDLFDTRQAASQIPNGEYKLVKGAGHFLHWEREDILPIYEEFLDRPLTSQLDKEVDAL